MSPARNENETRTSERTAWVKATVEGQGKAGRNRATVLTGQRHAGRQALNAPARAGAISDEALAAQALKDAGYNPSRGRGGTVGFPELGSLFEAEALPPSDANAQLGARIRALRKAKGLSVSDLAAHLSISARTLEGIQQGRGFSHIGMLALALERLEANLPVAMSGT